MVPTLSTIASTLATTSLKNVLRHRSWNEKAELEDPELEGPELTIRLEALTQRHNHAVDCTSTTAAVQKQCKELGITAPPLELFRLFTGDFFHAMLIASVGSPCAN